MVDHVRERIESFLHSKVNLVVHRSDKLRHAASRKQIWGAFEANRIWAAFAVTGVILGAAYLLWLYQRTVLGQVTNGKNLTLHDLNFREVAMFIPLIAWAIWIGIYPKPYFEILQRPVAEIVERVHPGYFNGGVLAGVQK